MASKDSRVRPSLEMEAVADPQMPVVVAGAVAALVRILARVVVVAMARQEAGAVALALEQVVELMEQMICPLSSLAQAAEVVTGARILTGVDVVPYKGTTIQAAGAASSTYRPKRSQIRTLLQTAAWVVIQMATTVVMQVEAEPVEVSNWLVIAYRLAQPAQSVAMEEMARGDGVATVV